MGSSGASSAGGGDVTKISTQVLAAPAATITFSAISGASENLVLVLVGALSDTGGAFDVGIRLNGDTAAHYQWTQVAGFNTGSTSSGSGGTAATSGHVGSLPGSSGGAAGSLRLFIPSYTQTAFLTKQVIGVGGYDNGANTSHTLTNWVEWVPGASAAVTQIDLIDTNGGNFVTGTRATLYREN